MIWSSRRRTGSGPRGCVLAALTVGLLVAAAGIPSSLSHADVTASGLNTTVTGVGNNFNITGGTRPNNGTNLFHSFGNFSLNTPESANFLNDSGLATNNIISRVTGGNPSNIFGTINTSAFGSANLFLMNPAGILFGATAQLNVGGSFHATTADYIKLGTDGGVIYADPAKGSVLTAAAPTAFGFLNPAPAPINVVTPAPGLLRVPVPGKTLSLVAGTVNVGATDGTTPGYVLAPAGRVNLVSVGSAGEATFDGTGFNVDGFAQLGDINLRGGSIVDGKEVFIRGGRLVIDNSLIMPGAFAFLGAPVPQPNGGEVNIKVSGDVTITGTRPEPFTAAPPGILAFNGSPNSIAPPAKVPDITIDAHSLSLSGFASIQTDRFGPGGSPNVAVTVDTMSVKNGAGIGLFNFFQGPGGSLTVNARQVDLSASTPGGAVGATGLLAQGLFHPGFGRSLDPALTNGDGGNINLNLSGNLSVSGLALITTDSLNFGRAGDITVNAGGDVLLAGTGGTGVNGTIASQSVFAGDAGNVTINASGKINIEGGFLVSSTTGGSGKAGNVTLTARGPITLSGTNTRVLSRTNQPPDSTLNPLFLRIFGRDFSFLKNLTTTILGIQNPTMFDVLRLLRDVFGFIQLRNDQLLPGNAGSVSISAPVLTLDSNASIQTSTGWGQFDPVTGQVVGNAGNINANVGSLFVNNGASILSSSGIPLLNPDGSIIGPVVGSGNAGSINVIAGDTISIAGSGSEISTTTFGNGNAGTISLNANQVNVQRAGSVSSESGGTLAGQLLVGTGNAGTVNITGTDISVSGTGSTISTSTLGNGNGGDVSLTAGRSVNIVNGGLVSADSLGGTGLAGNIKIVAGDQIAMDQGSVSTRAVTSDGGNITLNAPNLIQLTDSQVTTSVESGVGGGGNISIDPQALILNNSRILANAFGGPGGNINIVADVFLVNNNAAFPTSLTGIVDASSALSTPGTVNIEATFTNVEGSVTLLPETPLKATELLRAACAARFAGGKTSSLVVGGRDGLPPQPGDLLPSPLYLASDANTAAPGATTMTGYSQFSDLSFLGSRDRRLDRYTLLPNSKCS